MDEKPLIVAEVQKRTFETSKDKGWWEEADRMKEISKDAYLNCIGTKLALIHSEVSEALEHVRDGKLLEVEYGPNGKPEGFAIELLDGVIRTFDLFGYLGIDTEKYLREKMDYNDTRSYKHGRRI